MNLEPSNKPTADVYEYDGRGDLPVPTCPRPKVDSAGQAFCSGVVQPCYDLALLLLAVQVRVMEQTRHAGRKHRGRDHINTYTLARRRSEGYSYRVSSNTQKMTVYSKPLVCFVAGGG